MSEMPKEIYIGEFKSFSWCTSHTAGCDTQYFHNSIVQALREENARYREALGFYAAQDTYTLRGTICEKWPDGTINLAGEKARDTLKESK